MIKHRFIIRGADDFKIFAAIPCETQVLTWKKWVRPPNWEGLKELVERSLELLARSQVELNGLARLYGEIAEMESLREGTFEDYKLLDAFDAEFRSVMRQNENWAINQSKAVDTGTAQAGALLRDLMTDTTRIHWTGQVEECAKGLRAGDLIFDFAAHQEMAVHYRRMYARAAVHTHFSQATARCRKLAEYFQQIEDHGLALHQTFAAGKILAVKADSLLSSDPLPDTLCPPGTPFAAYTIEFKDSVFNIVEGCAWVAARNLAKRFSKRSEDEAQQPGPDGVYSPTPSELWFKFDTVTLDELSVEHTRGQHGISAADQDRVVEEMRAALLATDEEKRVVEIVTQLLVNKRLNPKAPERLPVTEVDPKDAHRVREAEQRDERESRAPKIRTIKFNVTPPRYLREAVQRVWASPGKHKKAHWVSGFWRNQPYGVGQSLRKETWIKPHIRGLGEAGAVVVRVAASDEEVAARDKTPEPDPKK